MAPTREFPFEDELQRLDHGALRALAIERLRARMGGFDPADIENAAQDVMEGLIQSVRRRGIPLSAEALVVRIARNIAADYIRARQHERIGHEGLAGEARHDAGAGGEDESLEAIRELAFLVCEYFRLRRAPCLPIAESKRAGISLKAHAERFGLSYDKVRKDWSRCVEWVFDAMRKGRLRLNWTLPHKRKDAR
jgi:DNA-directed RNA polymerase specialized sigma24 family protein